MKRAITTYRMQELVYKFTIYHYCYVWKKEKKEKKGKKEKKEEEKKKRSKCLKRV